MKNYMEITFLVLILAVIAFLYVCYRTTNDFFDTYI